MGIPRFMHKWMTQDLVYWRMTGNDGEGGFEFAAPVELKCRYEKKTEQVLTANGEEKVSRARLFTSTELQEGGYVYIGTLDDSNIPSDESPEKTEGAARILASDVIPNWNGITEIYIAYANMGSYNR